MPEPQSPVSELRVALTVSDYDAALAFYRDALGLPVILDWDEPTGRGSVLAAGRATLELITPRNHADRGSQVSVTHPHGYAVMQALIARGVIGDYREPQVMRFGFTPLYTGYDDLWQAVMVLKDILDRSDYQVDAKRTAVT